MPELRQSPQHARYMEMIGWRVEESDDGLYAYVKKLPLIPFSVMKVQRVALDKLDFAWLGKISRQHKVILSYVELLDRAANEKVCKVMRDKGYKASRNGMLPTKTWVIDLGKSDEKILSAMKSKTRYNIGLAKRNGLRVEVLNGRKMVAEKQAMHRFLKLVDKNNKRLKMMGVNEEWLRAQLRAFGTKAYVVMVKRKSDLLAAGLFMTTADASYYGYNGSTEQGRKLMAPTLVIWEGIREANRRGLVRVDFDGIYDKRYPNDRWKGFTRFKMSFGGHEVLYLPAFRKWWSLVK